MVKASSLYIIIVISLIIGILCSSLITIAYYQRLQVQRNLLIKKLHLNAESAMNLLLDDNSNIQNGEVVVLDLFGTESDSVRLKKNHWGIYDVATVSAFSGSLKNNKSVLYGSVIDAENKFAIYLTDQNHQLSLAGKTSIIGKCYLPEAGVRRAYIEGENFLGDKLITGEISKSKTTLPKLNRDIIDKLLNQVTNFSSLRTENIETVSETDTLINSFYDGEVILNSSVTKNLLNKKYEGNIIIFSDKLIEIDSSCKLNDIIIYAPAVVLKSGFSGVLQIFCTDSILVQENCVLKYPSALGLIKKDFRVQQPFIRLKEKSKIGGIIFTCREVEDLQQTLISIEREAIVHGQVYSDGFLELKGVVNGSAYCNKFYLRTPSSVYDNHILNGIIDYSMLSEYYVGSNLIENSNYKRIVKWLE